MLGIHCDARSKNALIICHQPHRYCYSKLYTWLLTGTRRPSGPIGDRFPGSGSWLVRDMFFIFIPVLLLFGHGNTTSIFEATKKHTSSSLREIADYCEICSVRQHGSGLAECCRHWQRRRSPLCVCDKNQTARVESHLITFLQRLKKSTNHV